LGALVVSSTASRDGLSAYAAASPAHVAGAIGVLCSALAGSDEALHAYREAFEEWRHQLGILSELQSDVQVVLRDRQILSEMALFSIGIQMLTVV
jgi:hypothetical protein